MLSAGADRSPPARAMPVRWEFRLQAPRRTSTSSVWSARNRDLDQRCCPYAISEYRYVGGKAETVTTSSGSLPRHRADAPCPEHMLRHAKMLTRSEIDIFQHGKISEQAGDLECPHQTSFRRGDRNVRWRYCGQAGEIVPLSGRSVPDSSCRQMFSCWRH